MTNGRYPRAVLSLFVLVAVGLIAAADAEPPITVPEVETWSECLRSDGDFFGLTVHPCKDPAGGPHDYGAVAYNGEPKPENFIGKLWGLKFYGERNGYDATRVRILLRTDDGADFISAEGARPDFTDYPEETDAVLLTIRLRGQSGRVGERTVVLVPSRSGHPAGGRHGSQAP